MSSISGNGATESVFLQMSGPGATPMQYSVGATPGSWNTITTWPVTINNSNPTPGSSSILNVKATQKLTISSSTGGTSGYFIAGTTYITFDGSGNTITIDTITSYPGFIRNGTSGANGKSNIAVQNFTTTISGASTLASQAGWLCQAYFSRGGIGNTITNCTNNGEINNTECGGIVGVRAGFANGSISVTNCTNNGSIDGVSTNAGGVVGSSFGGIGSSITGCTNTGAISGSNAGGIAGGSCSRSSGNSATITSCTNTGTISGTSAGGITGQYTAEDSGICNITSCTNTGNISAINSGGIVGGSACRNKGTCNITKCISTGNITGASSGGIAGSQFAYDTSTNNIISNCYSIGNISGTNAGGIVGQNVGSNDLAYGVSFTPVVDISNCYSLGTIATSCGGICGGSSYTYTNKATINITNSYSYGALSGTGSGLVAASLTSANINLTTTNTYVAAGSWTDAAANAALTGTPTSLTSGNPGATWAKVVAGTTGNPYVLASYNAALYSPSSASSALNYNTSAGLYTDSSYSLVYSSQSGNTATIRVFAYKGTSPNYYSYNFNTFAFTNTTGIGGTIGSRINTSTGVLTIGAPALITANGSTQYVGLRMDISGNNTIQYSTDQSTWNTLDGSFNWPVTINNSNPGSSSILNVKATQGLTISSSTGGTSGYFIAGTTYITFDGSGNTIMIDTITTYPGFIRNGTSDANGKSNIAVKNFTTTISGASTLLAETGWLCQSYFSNGVAGNTITSCTNYGAITTATCGGIVGGYAAANSGVMDISGCTNTGSMLTAANAGGIAGVFAGYINSTLTFTNCTNSGVIGGDGGGIAGGSCARTNSTVTITSCTNTGTISGISSGGIVGSNSALGSGIITITSCANTGDINDQYSGGIVGAGAGRTGKVTITNCYNAGTIGSYQSGGIAGRYFARDSSQNCVVARCYNVGNITGSECGGILGGNPGYTTIAVTPLIDISSCYSIGAITATAGGILGGWDGATYTTDPTINITNCYGFDNATAANSRIIAPSYTKPTTQTNCYAATTGWTDAAANANLTGTPTSLTSGNPGATWATIATNTPYILSAFNAALYSPSSASAEYGYATSAGLFTPGYTYQILQNSQSGATATTQVVAYKGASTNYNSYNINTFAMTNQRGAFLISATINSSTGVLSYTLGTPCFLEGTKILCLKNNVEQYQPIESLRKGDLVKSIYNGYVPIYMIGTTSFYNPGNDYRVVNRLYKCPKENYPSLFEDLYITGCHSILVPSMTDDQWENTKAVNGNVFVTDNHFRLIACADEKALPFNKEGFMNIYHIALEHSDKYMNYGIYANGLLVETCSKRYIKELSGMRILGEEDCTASQSMQLDNVFNKNTGLIETC